MNAAHPSDFLVAQATKLHQALRSVSTHFVVFPEIHPDPTGNIVDGCAKRDERHRIRVIPLDARSGRGDGNRAKAGEVLGHFASRP